MTTFINLWKDDFTGEVLDVEIYQTDIVPQDMTEEELSDISYYDSLAENL